MPAAAQPPAQTAQAADLKKFLPRPPSGWASEDSEEKPSLPNQVMGTYYRENGDGGDATLIIAKQQPGAQAVPGVAGSGAGPAKETPVTVNGFRGKLTKQDGTLILAMPVGSHAIVITASDDTKADDLLALARAVDTASLSKR